ncbi:MAG: U32 family peptidase C-terminal domain-containing protein [Bdellovibrionia bacterium]
MAQPVELLAPAGSYRKLEQAYAFGADAAYVGLPLFSLRARENDMTLEELSKARELATQLNKKLYFTLNIFARNRKLNPLQNQMEEIIKLKPDALIMSDPGMMNMVREKFPEVPIHLSVQANCMNWQSVKFWHEALNIERVILSRELSLNEIKEIKQRVPDVELEAFVHGAICIAYSGRCLLSSYFSYRDANQGVCDNSCRENYKVFAAPANDTEYFLEDFRNPGKLYPIHESEEGTTIMNAKDLALIEHLQEIIDAGVCSLKIEGRSKSEYYVSMVTKAYRQALDQIYAGKSFDPKVWEDLEKVSNRGYHRGFMIAEDPAQMQNYDTACAYKSTHKFIGLEKQSEADAREGYVAFEVRNKLKLGETVELVEPHQQARPVKVEGLLNAKGEEVAEVHGGTGVFYLKLAQAPAKYSLLCKTN